MLNTTSMKFPVPLAPLVRKAIREFLQAVEQNREKRLTLHVHFAPPHFSVFLEDVETKVNSFNGQFGTLDDEDGDLSEFSIFFVTLLDNLGVQGIPENFVARSWVCATPLGRESERQDIGVDALVQTATHLLFFADLDDEEDEALLTDELVKREELTLPRIILLYELLERQPKVKTSVETVILMGKLHWEKGMKPPSKGSMLC